MNYAKTETTPTKKTNKKQNHLAQLRKAQEKALKKLEDAKARLKTYQKLQDRFCGTDPNQGNGDTVNRASLCVSGVLFGTARAKRDIEKYQKQLDSIQKQLSQATKLIKK